MDMMVLRQVRDGSAADGAAQGHTALWGSPSTNDTY